MSLPVRYKGAGAFWGFVSIHLRRTLVINVISLLVVLCLSLFPTLVCIGAADKITSRGYILIKRGQRVCAGPQITQTKLVDNHLTAFPISFLSLLEAET